MKTFFPPSKSPINQWVFSGGEKPNDKSPPTKWVKKGTGKSAVEQWVFFGGKRITGNGDRNEMPDRKGEEMYGSKRFVNNVNYKGRNPMTKSQWRRFQRQKKADALKDVTNVNKNADKGKNQEQTIFDTLRNHDIERIFPPLSVVKKGLSIEDEELTSNFTDFEVSLNIILVVSMLPMEYDLISEVTEDEEDFTEEMVSQQPKCYFVMDNGCVIGQHAMFERPDYHMQQHLKPLFIQAKINDVGINKVLVDGGATINFLPHFLLKNIRLSESDLKPHNVVLCNYEGKSGSSFGAIEVDLVVRIVKMATLFLVVESKANYNLLLGREWIHGVGVLPSIMHQRLSLWKENVVL